MHIGIHAHHSTVTLHNALVHRIRMQVLGEGLGDIVLHRTEESHLRVLTALPSPTYPSRHLLLTAEIWASSLCQPCPHSAFLMPPTPRPATYAPSVYGTIVTNGACSACGRHSQTVARLSSSYSE